MEASSQRTHQSGSIRIPAGVAQSPQRAGPCSRWPPQRARRPTNAKKTRWGSAEPQRVTCSLAKSLRRGPPGSPALARGLRQESPDPLLISFGGISTCVTDSACVTTLLNPRTQGRARSPPYTVFEVNRPFRAVHHRHHMPPRTDTPLRTNRIRFSCFL